MKKSALLVIYVVLVLGMMNYFTPFANLQMPELPSKLEPENEVIQVSVIRKEEEIKVPLEEYLIGVVGSEMPSHFELEALKAQSVAARTFVVNRKYQVDDTVASQAYHSQDELKRLWGSGYEERIKRVRQAVYETAGEIMTFEGQVISALYFSTSNGKTANSEEYYTSKLPYLRSVDSPWDLDLNPKAQSTVFFTFAQLQSSLGASKSISSFTIQSRFDDNRVNQAKINGQLYSGREIREKLGLRSSDFTVRKTQNGYEIVTTGYGHGVGMSQYGAQGMALEGSKYQDILEHYYQNIEVIQLSEYKGKN